MSTNENHSLTEEIRRNVREDLDRTGSGAYRRMQGLLKSVAVGLQTRPPSSTISSISHTRKLFFHSGANFQ